MVALEKSSSLILYTAAVNVPVTVFHLTKDAEKEISGDFSLFSYFKFILILTQFAVFRRILVCMTWLISETI